MVVRLSCDDHVIVESCCIQEGMCGCANWGSDGDLGCNGMSSHGFSQVQSGPIHETKQVGEVLRGVGEVMLTGSKHG